MNKSVLKDAISLRQLHLSRRVWWIRSYPTLRKWVERDMEKKNYLKTIKVGEGKTTKIRYYFLKENIEKYVREFEKGEF